MPPMFLGHNMAKINFEYAMKLKTIYDIYGNRKQMKYKKEERRGIQKER